MHQAVEKLEARRLFALNPTPSEQELLFMLNRFRADPQAEYNILTQTGDKDVQAAIDFFGVDLNVLKQQFSSLTAAQPLAWNASLRGAAIAHSDAMLAADEQTHQAPGEKDLATRIKDAGYANMSVAAENVYAFATSMFDAHASFAIDWGDGPDGIQNPAGHRINMLNDEYREVGMGVVDAPSGDDVGPILVTQDFGDRFDFGNSYYLGTVYNDANHDSQYNAGEGISGARITLTGAAGTFSTTSMSAGGYQIEVPDGAYSVTATSASLGGTVSLSDVKIGAENVLQDFTPQMVRFGNVASNMLTITGSDEGDTIGVTESGDTLRVRRNGTLETFDADGVDAIQILGGDGNDVIDFTGIDIDTYVDAGAGNDYVTGGAGDDTISGGAGKDTLYGGDGNDRINGDGTADHLYGQGGDDRLYGGAANDLLDGGGGVDHLYGGDNNDTLLGGGSNDKLYGQAGNDLLQGQAGNDLMNGGSGTDSAVKDAGDTVVSVESLIS